MGWAIFFAVVIVVAAVWAAAFWVRIGIKNALNPSGPPAQGFEEDDLLDETPPQILTEDPSLRGPQRGFLEERMA